ncbi:MAG: Ig-like domain-containing protein, partial [Actinomycetota bacterium]
MTASGWRVPRDRVAAILGVALVALSLGPLGPLGPPGVSAVSGNLNVEPETAELTVGTPHELVASLGLAPVTGDVLIDFEVESGPNDADGDTPEKPDGTCTIPQALPAGETPSCKVQFQGAKAGTDLIRAWIDADGKDETVEADKEEPRQDPQAGDDTTDLVEVTWKLPPSTPSKITMDPPSAVNRVDTPYTVSAIVLDQSDRPMPDGAEVSFKASGTGAEKPGSEVVTTKEGKATFTFTSSKPGTSTITAIVGKNRKATAKAIWAGDPSKLTISPSSATNATGATHTVTVTVRDAADNPVVDGTRVDFAVSGTGAESPPSASVTTKEGKATFAFTSSEPGTSTITATAGEAKDTATVTWEKPVATKLTLSPSSAAKRTGESHSVLANVKDQFGNNLPGVRVRFSVTGANQVPPSSAVTPANGNVELTYVGSNPGNDTITAFVD